MTSITVNEASGADKTRSFEMSWGSSASSGYCSDEDSDPEFEQFFTARTSFFPKTRLNCVKNENVKKVSGARMSKIKAEGH